MYVQTRKRDLIDIEDIDRQDRMAQYTGENDRKNRHKRKTHMIGKTESRTLYSIYMYVQTGQQKGQLDRIYR